jgi:hypothetical protein
MISVILASMNRTSRVAQILESWACQEIIGEIIICDWSSNEKITNNSQIQEIIKKYNKIKIIRIDNQEIFNLSKAYNLAYKFTNPKFKFLLKIDADYVLKDKSIFDVFFSLNLDECFIGKNKQMQNGFYVYCGFFFIKKIYYPTFNEKLLPVYGKDDLELYSRIEDLYKLKIKVIDVPKYVDHIPHDRNSRYENYKTSGQISPTLFKKIKKWYPQEYIILENKKDYIKVCMKDKDANTPDNYSILEYNKSTFYEPPTIFQNPPINKY